MSGRKNKTVKKRFGGLIPSQVLTRLSRKSSSEGPVNFPSLNLANISVNAANATPRRSGLCGRSIFQQIQATRADLVSITPSEDQHGEGTYGYVTSAELYMKGAGARGPSFNCIAAMKVSHDLPTANEGVAADLIREMGAYCRTQATNNVAKAMYMKIQGTSQVVVMEHYLMNLKDFTERYMFRKRAPPSINWDLLYPIKVHEQLVRAILFQAAKGLLEFHQAGFLHKDLKAPNLLIAADGTVLVADFGLSAYVPTTVRPPRKIYYLDTTPTIQPPEAAVRSRAGVEGINDTYDSFSLGTCLAYFLLHDYPFDFYKRGDNWKDTVTNANYKSKTAPALQFVSDSGYSPACRDLLRRLLSTDPADRPRAAEIVIDPWFRGLTLSAAKKVVRSVIRAERNTEGRPFIKHVPKLLEAAKRKGAAANDPEIANYFRLSPAPPGMPRITAETVARKADGSPQLNSSWYSTGKLSLFQSLWKKGVEIEAYTVLVALELFQRYVTVKGEEVVAGAPSEEPVLLTPYPTAYICLLIADNSGPFEPVGPRLNVEDISRLCPSVGTPPTLDALAALEVKILMALQGDILPLREGYVEFVLRYLGRTHPEKRVRAYILMLFMYGCWDGKNGGYEDFFSLVDRFIESHEAGEIDVPVALQPMKDQIVDDLRTIVIRDMELHDLFLSSEGHPAGFRQAWVNTLLGTEMTPPPSKPHCVQRIQHLQRLIEKFPF